MNPPSISAAKTEFIPPPLRAHQAAELWLALQKKEAAGLAWHRNQVDADAEGLRSYDPLNDVERRLYNHLAARLVHESAIVAIASTPASPS